MSAKSMFLLLITVFKSTLFWLFDSNPTQILHVEKYFVKSKINFLTKMKLRRTI